MKSRLISLLLASLLTLFCYTEADTIGLLKFIITSGSGFVCGSDTATLTKTSGADVTVEFQIGIPEGSAVTFDWGDGNSEEIVGPVGSYTFGNTYGDTNEYTITISDCLADITLMNFGNNLNVSGDYSVTDNMDSVTSFYTYTSNVEDSVANLTHLSNLSILNISSTDASGAISNLNSLTGLTQLNLSYTNVTGSLADITSLSALTRLYITNTSVSGALSNLSSFSLVFFTAGSSSVSGDLNILGSEPNITYFNVATNTSGITYTTTTLTNYPSGTQLLINNIGLSQSEVDTFLCDLASASTTYKPSRLLNIGGSNAYPSSTGLACRTTLLSRGWTVTL